MSSINMAHDHNVPIPKRVELMHAYSSKELKNRLSLTTHNGEVKTRSKGVSFLR